MNFAEVEKLLNQEIDWAKTEGVKLDAVSEEYHNGYVAGLEQAKLLLAVYLLDIDEILQLYGYDPAEVRQKAAEIASLALEAAYNKSLLPNCYPAGS